MESDAVSGNVLLESAWLRENRYRKNLMTGLWRLAQEAGVLTLEDPMAGMVEDEDGEIDFQETAEDFLEVVRALVTLAKYLPMPEPGQENRLRAEVAIQLGATKIPRLQKLSTTDVLAVIKQSTPQT